MTFELNTAMIFAAGRGERMRPLTDTVPKPLLEAGGKALIVWQIEALVAAGIQRIVINHAWLGDAIETTLGDGSRWGVEIAYSREGAHALETAGGIARAFALLCGPTARTEAETETETPTRHTVFLAVSGDVYTDFDYAALRARAQDLHAQTEPGLHLIMVPNPPYHPRGDFVLDGDRLVLDHAAGQDAKRNALAAALSAAHQAAHPAADQTAKKLTFANIGLYDSRTFAPIAAMHPIPRMPLLPIYQDAIATSRATGECWHGRWANVGTPEDLATLDRALRAALQAR